MGTLTNEQTLSQLRLIRACLLENGYIDKRIALELCDCDRLSARIWDLRHDPVDPMKIRTIKKGKKNRFGHLTQYAVYELEKEEERLGI